MKAITSLVGLGTLAVMVSACGGGALTASCANGSACGGDIVGVWTVASSCLSVSGTDFDMDCPTATVTSSNTTLTGTQTYGADSTYRTQLTVSVKAIVTLPMSCLAVQGFALTCAQVTQLLMADGSFKAATCTAAGTGCACSVAAADMESSDVGTYTTSNGVVTTTDSTNGDFEQDAYCVKGNTMTQSPTTMSGMVTTGARVSGSITFTK